MVTVVMLNPCIDRMLVVGGLKAGGLNIVSDSYEMPAGKGLNLAAALRTMRAECILTGLMFEKDAEIYISELSKLDIPYDFIIVPGSVRINTKVIDKTSGSVTELNKRGERVDKSVVYTLRCKVERLAGKSDFTVFTGSAPPGLPDDIYRQLIETAKRAGSKCVLDADGELFKKGVEAAPFLVKPNLPELERYSGRKLDTIPSIKEAAAEIVRRGVGIVLSSLGKSGAMLTNGETALFCAAAEVPVINPTGAGDAMLSGALYALLNNMPLTETLKIASAAAALSVTQPGPILSDAARIGEYVKIIEVTEV